MNQYIAVDIGASSGRLILSQLEDGLITMKEVHRFKNGFAHRKGCDRWDVNYLVTEILKGLEKVKKQGVNACYVGIDTWAVDYCLIDAQGQLLELPIAYRDKRTEQAVSDFSKELSLERLYEKTGIQIQPFNTVFQLFVEDEELLSRAEKLLLIPDYLGYVFTGKAVMEKSNASTMQMLNPGTQMWDLDILSISGITPALFPPLVDAGTVLGPLKRAQFPAYDLPEATLINVASHDTASAVVGTPGQGDTWAYISSGTWSLLGVETQMADVSQAAFRANYTNEWGACNTIRFLKNIMGMWLIQEVARNQEYRYSYAELAALAARQPPFQQMIDINDDRFLNPLNMIEAIQAYCRETGQQAPVTPAELARCIYDNLALCYAKELAHLCTLTGAKGLHKLHIVGGGSNNELLNQLTADLSGVEVESGPAEATAIGNIVMQMLCMDEFADLREARAAIHRSFECKRFVPRASDSRIMARYLEKLKSIKEKDGEYDENS